jgi:hypothetical protein
MKNFDQSLVENLKNTRQDYLGLFLERLLERGYKIILENCGFFSCGEESKRSKERRYSF